MSFDQFASFQEISLDGFQVVSSSMFSHMPRYMTPTCTLWSKRICFSKYALYALNKCELVRIEVNTGKRSILITPVTSADRDAVRWVRKVKQDIEPRKMECKDFTMPIFDAWGWDKEYVYRAKGQIVTSDQKVMMLFDFSYPEKWKCKEKAAANG